MGELQKFLDGNKPTNTATIKYTHPLVDEARKRGFVYGAKYTAMRSGEHRIVSDGPCYYDTEYDEVVIGGFVIARKMDFRLNNTPNYFAWAEMVDGVAERNGYDAWVRSTPLHIQEKGKLTKDVFIDDVPMYTMKDIEDTWSMALDRSKWEVSQKRQEDYARGLKEWLNHLKVIATRR